MRCVISFTVVSYFLLSVSAMPRLKGIGQKQKKSLKSFIPDDSRPILCHRKPIQADNEDEAPVSRKRKTSRISLSAHGDRDATLEATVGAQGRRLAIAVYFIDIMDAPHESEWDEQDGTVAIIQRRWIF